jgi:hypothetical protein
MESLDIVHNSFTLRWYQLPVYNAIEKEGFRRVLYVAPRRCGKDYLGWNLAIRQCLKKTCLVFYVLPTYSQGRKAIFDAITIDSKKFLDCLPHDFIASINQSEMKIRFKNDSILQVIGGDTYDNSLVGTNPFAVILSEYSLMPADIFSYIRPILAANGGWCLFVGTPRGKNHMYRLHKFAETSQDWKVVYQKTSEIKHITDEVLAQEKAEMEEGLFLQEYECSYERGIEGSYYGTFLDRLKKAGQICPVPWDPGLTVNVAFDIGVNDATTMIFWQQNEAQTAIRIIDCYSNNNLGLDHYVKILQDKPYRYDKYFAPHDIKVREWGGGAVTRFEKARQLGITFTLVDQVPIIDGIENVWTHFPKFWIDERNCRSLVNALENYRKEWDEQKQIYMNKPVKSWANHYADCLRYMCLSLHKTSKGRSSAEFDRARMEALYSGSQSHLPPVFRNDNNNNWLR